MKEAIISRYFMKEVLGGCVSDYNDISVNSQNVKFTKNNSIELINKWEFMHRCKEYISDFNNLANLSTHRNFYSMTDGGEWSCGFLSIHTTYSDDAEYDDICTCETEFEAVILSTQWVIYNKEKHERL